MSDRADLPLGRPAAGLATLAAVALQRIEGAS